MRLSFIVNEKSGNGNGAKIWRKIESELSIPYEVHKTTYEKQAIEFARAIVKESNESKNQTLLVGIGGDGTYHEILNGIQHAQYVVLGAVCAGSGNDFKRAYGQFENAAQIERFIQANSSIAQDAGVIHASDKLIYFVNNSGIGFDATVAITANESKVKKAFNKVGLGKLCYVYYLIKCLFMFKPFQLVVQHNGNKKTYENVWFVTASNQPFFGGGMKISPTSLTDDGVIELTIVHNLSKYKLLFVFMTVFFGKHTRFKEIELLKAPSFTIHMNENYLIHADGEKLSIETKDSPITFAAEQSNWQLAKKSH